MVIYSAEMLKVQKYVPDIFWFPFSFIIFTATNPFVTKETQKIKIVTLYGTIYKAKQQTRQFRFAEIINKNQDKPPLASQLVSRLFA